MPAAPPSPDTLTLDGEGLDPAAVAAVARGSAGRRIELADIAVSRMAAAEALKDDLIARGLPLYGVTSGFGDSNTRQVAGHKSRRLQENLIRFLSCGTGPLAAPTSSGRLW